MVYAWSRSPSDIAVELVFQRSFQKFNKLVVKQLVLNKLNLTVRYIVLKDVLNTFVYTCYIVPTFCNTFTILYVSLKSDAIVWKGNEHSVLLLPGYLGLLCE